MNLEMTNSEIFSIRAHALASNCLDEYEVIQGFPGTPAENWVEVAAYLIDAMDMYLISNDGSDDACLEYLNNVAKLAQIGMIGYRATLGNDIPYTRIADQMSDTYKRKNADYGDSFSESLDRYGAVAAHVRISDKINRLRSLVVRKQPAQVKDESIADTFLDLACYAIMRLVYIEQKSETVEEETETDNER